MPHRAMLERRVIVPNFAKEVQLRSREHECGGDAMNRRVAPSLIIEATRCIEVVKVCRVGIRTEEVEVGNLKIRPN